MEFVVINLIIIIDNIQYDGLYLRMSVLGYPPQCGSEYSVTRVHQMTVYI